MAMLLMLPQLCGALSLNEYHANGDDTVDLFIAGSSEQDHTLQRLFRQICAPNSLDVYSADNGSVRLLFCRTRAGGADAVPGLAPGQKVALHKSSIGGSGSGVGPLIEKTPVAFLNVADLRAHFADRCPPTRRSQYAADGGLSGYTENECDDPTPVLVVPDAGISDVEPRLLLRAYHLPPDAADVLHVQSANAFIFGVPVSLSLRDALQAAKFPPQDPCNPGNPHYADLVDANLAVRVKRGETEPCMPSLTRAQVAGIFAGTLRDWGQIVNAHGYALATKNGGNGSIISPPGVRAPSDERVNICRRVDTSGTQAAYEMFFLNRRCAPGVRPFVDAGPTVFLGSASADVRSCLNRLDRQNVWAVGTMSTQIVESLRDDHWRFIKIDGVAPTLLNTYNGRWLFFVEQTFQWRDEHSDAPLRGLKRTLIAHIGWQLGNPVILRDLNRDFRHAWGSAGAMGMSGPPPRPTPGKPVDSAALDDNPMLAVRHDSSNCNAVIAEYPTALP
jgi:hypothetical protein